MGVPWMPEFSGLPQPEVDHPLGKQEAILGLQGNCSWRPSIQVCRGSRDTGKSERLRVVSVYVQGCQGKVHTMLGWCCQVAEGGYVLGTWLRHTPRDVLTLMMVIECATTWSSKRGSSLCRIPLVLSGQKGWCGSHIMGNCWTSRQ